MCGCSSNRYETDAWNVVEKAVGNQKELTHFLEHYKQCGDKERYEAACFLVGNMSGKYSIAADNEVIEDVTLVKADSLIASLEYSFRLREESAFLKEYSFEQFLEYILPYRIAHEPLEYYEKNYFVFTAAFGSKYGVFARYSGRGCEETQGIPDENVSDSSPEG